MVDRWRLKSIIDWSLKTKNKKIKDGQNKIQIESSKLKQKIIMVDVIENSWLVKDGEIGLMIGWLNDASIL